MAIQTIPPQMIGITQNSTGTVAINPGVVIYEQATTLTNSYCITTGTNAITKSPFNIANGVTLTVPNGSTWVVI
jgi:hypothetical protein